MSWSTVGLDELFPLMAKPSFLVSAGLEGGCVMFMVSGAGLGFDEGLFSIFK